MQDLEKRRSRLGFDFRKIPLTGYQDTPLPAMMIWQETELNELARVRTFGSSQERRQVTLTLTMLRCPDAVAPETRVLHGGEFSIGRGSENDWVLPDPERFLSKRHCMLAYRSGSWQVADLSTNGTFVNGEAEPIGHGEPRDLRDGDRLRFGSY